MTALVIGGLPVFEPALLRLGGYLVEASALCLPMPLRLQLRYCKEDCSSPRQPGEGASLQSCFLVFYFVGGCPYTKTLREMTNKSIHQSPIETLLRPY